MLKIQSKEQNQKKLIKKLTKKPKKAPQPHLLCLPCHSHAKKRIESIVF